MSLVLILFSLIFQVHAKDVDRCLSELDPNSKALITRVFFEDYQKEGSIYLPRQCGRNVKELLLDLKEHHVDIAHTEVLFILNEFQNYAGVPDLQGGLHPAHSRGNVQSWDFHVVLRYNNPTDHKTYILDLDGPSEPKPIRAYFNYMFPNRRPDEDRAQQITVRRIDSAKYLEAFETYYQTRDKSKSLDDNYVVGDFKKADPTVFPTMTLKEYLNKTVPRRSLH